MEWVHYQNEMAKWVRYVVKLGDGSVTTSGGTTISGLDEMPGTLADGDSLNTVTAFSQNSTQDVLPTTAADVGATATVSVAAHNVIYDAGTVAYNSGSVAGLAFSTEYSIYADDPTKAGGAVTYLATTDKTDLPSNAGRYFVGKITTPADGAGDTGGDWGGSGGLWPDP